MNALARLRHAIEATDMVAHPLVRGGAVSAINPNVVVAEGMAGYSALGDFVTIGVGAGAVPGEIVQIEPERIVVAPCGDTHALSVNDLLVQAVGAKLTGKGAFTFDNTDMRTIPGMPRPEGAIDLALNGANALIDNLIAMGIISDQEAMPARMMMGMFAVPGDGPDSLKSKIEINAQGHILANGQRIK